MTNLKSRLFAARAPMLTTVNILGGEFQLKLLTAARLSDHDKKIVEAKNNQDAAAISKLTVGLLLDSIVDGDGVASDTISIAEFQEQFNPREIASASSELFKANFSLDGALDEAKND